MTVLGLLLMHCVIACEIKCVSEDKLELCVYLFDTTIVVSDKYTHNSNLSLKTQRGDKPYDYVYLKMEILERRNV